MEHTHEDAALLDYLVRECGGLILRDAEDRRRLVKAFRAFAATNSMYVDSLVEERLLSAGWLARDGLGLLKVGKKAYKEAMSVQDAVNPLPIVRAFYLATLAVHKASDELSKGTDWIREHPVVVLFASKIESLVRSGDPPTFRRAYMACRDELP